MKDIEVVKTQASATDTVAVNRHEWTDKGVTRVLLPGDPLDPKMPGYAALVGKGMTRADFDAIEDDDRAKRIAGLRKRQAELQVDIDALLAEDVDVKARRTLG